MSVASLIYSLHQIGAIKLGNFVLKSGQTSNIYIDIRAIVSYPKLLQTIANFLWDYMRHCQFDLICGVPYAALPIATCLSLQHQIPMILRRKEKKLHGTKKQIEGVYQAGQSCLIIEDIITTGGSVIETLNDLKAAGLTVSDVVVLVDREQLGEKVLAQHGIKLHSVLTLSDITNELIKQGLMGAAELP